MAFRAIGKLCGNSKDSVSSDDQQQQHPQPSAIHLSTQSSNLLSNQAQAHLQSQVNTQVKTQVKPQPDLQIQPQTKSAKPRRKLSKPRRKMSVSPNKSKSTEQALAEYHEGHPSKSKVATVEQVDDPEVPDIDTVVFGEAGAGAGSSSSGPSSGRRPGAGPGDAAAAAAPTAEQTAHINAVFAEALRDLGLEDCIPGGNEERVARGARSDAELFKDFNKFVGVPVTPGLKQNLAKAMGAIGKHLNQQAAAEPADPRPVFGPERPPLPSSKSESETGSGSGGSGMIPRTLSKAKSVFKKDQ